MVILSPNFPLSALTLSEVAARNDIDMTVSDAVLANLKRLCLEILEPIRTKVGRPVIVTSGYRPEVLNEIIGGSKNSDHLTGSAADIHVPGMALVDLAECVESLQMQIPLKQCIIEFQSWVHVSIQSPGEVPRREFLTATRQDGQTVYSLGLNA